MVGFEKNHGMKPTADRVGQLDLATLATSDVHGPGRFQRELPPHVGPRTNQQISHNPTFSRFRQLGEAGILIPTNTANGLRRVRPTPPWRDRALNGIPGTGNRPAREPCARYNKERSAPDVRPTRGGSQTTELCSLIDSVTEFSGRAERGPSFEARQSVSQLPIPLPDNLPSPPHEPIR